ncbi:MAG: RluA family pseudouridine synthase [Burkholderiales bacterium]|jgi:23S rRNA pseudouridine955/2504/2580 synthase|nr:RluA family pseudouridine synthase [Burkholderiales bacterium]
MNDQRNPFVRYVTIDEAGDCQRLDNFLKKTLKGAPPSLIYRVIRSGEVRVNGARARAETHLAVGDRLRIPPVRLSHGVENRIAGIAPSPMKRAAMKNAAEIPVIFEDEWLLAVNKPAGLAVHGGSGVSFGVIEELRVKRSDCRFLELVHRLDRETSGVLLMAKKRAALTALHALWREGAIEKYYALLVRGHWRDSKRKVALPLLRTIAQNQERRVRVSEEGDAAETVFYRRDVWTLPEFSATLLDAHLLTGRTHQIRVHAAHLGHPLAGDDKYGDFAWNKRLSEMGLSRMFLHARELTLIHPMTQAPITLTAELPFELSAFLQRLAEKTGANQGAPVSRDDEKRRLK